MSYTYPLPQLKDYDVSPKTGFLPETLPVARLPAYYDIWENTVNVLPALLLTKRIRSVIDKFECLDLSHLQSEEQYRRAYSVLGFLAHAYIWGVDTPTNKLPKQIADPWVKVSEKLRIPPIATYAGLCLWNWKEILPFDEATLNDDDSFLDNLQTINTYTGSIDESWFYLVSVYFEYRCAPCIKLGLDAIQYARDNNVAKVTECLKQLAESIDYLGSVLMKMEEMCDPHVFYFRLRPYLAGWKNMNSAGLPDGVYYGDETEPRILSGGSNAQSSSIQTLDLILNVDHNATGESEENKGSDNPFMAEMRKYMPGKHSDFLEHLAKVNVIRDFVMKNKSKHNELVLAYDASVAMLKSFRDKHIRIVTRYIVIQSRKENNMGSDNLQKNTLRAGLAGSNQSKDNVLRGTGGTALLPFLKQCRDETGNTAAGNWGKRILSVKEKPTESPTQSPKLSSPILQTKESVLDEYNKKQSAKSD